MLTYLGAGLLLALAAARCRRSLERRAVPPPARRRPGAVELRRLPAGAWRDAAAAERLAQPLRDKVFVDLGVFEVLPLVGFRLGVMVQESAMVAAFIRERPREPAPSLELAVRYADGTTSSLAGGADSGAPARSTASRRSARTAGWSTSSPGSRTRSGPRSSWSGSGPCWGAPRSVGLDGLLRRGLVCPASPCARARRLGGVTPPISLNAYSALVPPAPSWPTCGGPALLPERRSCQA